MPIRNYSDGQEVVMDDFNAAQLAVLKDIYDRFAYEVTNRTENAFFGDSFLVSYSSANTVIVKKGLGFQTDALAVSPNLKRKPIVLAEDRSLNITNPHAVNPRIDIVCVKSAIVTEISGQRNYKDANSGNVSLENFVLQKDWSSDFQVVAGVAAPVPAAPAVPAGYIKIAELTVTPIVGLTGSGDVSDSRVLVPVGSAITVNTTGYQKLPASGATSLQTLFASIDSYLKFGSFDFIDLTELDTSESDDEPGNPDADKRRLFFRDNVLYIKGSAGTKVPVGSGAGGGGGGATWQPVAGFGPLPENEYDEKVWKFEQGAGQSLVLWVKVPSGYIPGREISLNILCYCPSTTNNWKMQATTSLVRKNVDQITSTINQNIAHTGDVPNVLSNQLVERKILLSSALGTINSIAVSAGDLLKVELSRVATTGADDATDVRFIPSATEVLF